MAVALARIWGLDNPSLTFMKRRWIEDAACRQLAYDHGFPKSTGGSMLKKWASTLTSGVKGGATDPLASRHRGSKSVTEKNEEERADYLHELYRYAISTVGIKATFKELSDSMNGKTQSPTELRSDLNLHYQQVYKWWKKQGGKEKSPFEKPQLTDEHKANRVLWVKR